MVNDKEYEDALNNHDNQMIMHSASVSFVRILDEDEIYRCKLIALWEALQAWKPDRGSKFTAFLYQRVKWECLKSIQNQKQYRDIQLDNIDQEVLPETSIDELLEILPEDLKGVVKKRYLYNMTLREIGDEYGYSYETARKKLKKASKCVKMVYN
jgi:RNA polymerase sigma factor (sigma-70 family)